MKKILSTSLALFVLIFPVMAGATTVRFLENYDQLRPGKFLQQVYIDNRTIRMNGYAYIAVKDIDVSRIEKSWGLKPQDAAAFLKRELQVSAENAQIGRFFEFDAVETAPAVLELAITEQSSGNVVGRLFTAVFSWGQAYFRVEGRIRDTKTNRIIATFNHFESSKAVFPLRDLGQNGGVTMIKEMLTHTSKQIVKEFGNIFGYIPATLKDDLPFKYS